MKSIFGRYKLKLFCSMTNPYSFLFHIIGITAIIWFLFRVLPKPDRIQYPCQQLSMTVALSYITFWSLMWGLLFHGLRLWIKKTKLKTTGIIPIILTIFVLVSSITTMVYANNYNNDNFEIISWTPIPNEPIGIPKGVNPGRVVWVWDPDATESDLNGFWWLLENNDQDVIDSMFSKGIKSLTDQNDNRNAWNELFRYFNNIHGYDDYGYRPGEKIAIKVNLNNCWESFSYIKKDNDRDASPYVVKALLRQLVDDVGVAQDDITIYDASREMGNWFYRRVYYEKYPSSDPEFPDIHYVDCEGGAIGREKVQASSEKIFFADETGLSKTLPTCVVEAKYIINMPILKRHPIQQGVTLSGKNFFGTWIEPVANIHNYHRTSFTLGNPAPQTDLFAHDQIGGKTVLYIGDGLYATKDDHCTISKFQMYPFNDDWTNSLFFSQDPVAIDSVMYDFLHAEGADPVEGSQYYLHQSAEPPLNFYDPEDDGIFVSESLGVHEHWNLNYDVFSPERYSGPTFNGIDFIAVGEEYVDSWIEIIRPKKNTLYVNGEEKGYMPSTIIIGDIVVQSDIFEISNIIERVEFYLDDELMFVDYDEPYEWIWDETSFGRKKIKAIAYENSENFQSDTITVWKLF